MTNSRRPLFFTVLFLASPLAAPAAERNIVFVITDDESPTLGCYDDPVAVTPAIDAIAADGMVFDNAFATTASCSASRSVVLSGIHNHRNGQFGHQHHYHKFTTFPDVARLALPRVLSAAGYRTARIGKYHVAPEIVYHFDRVIPGPTRNPVRMAENCRDFIAADDDRPFFLYFATSDPHRSGKLDQTSTLDLKPDRFGNLPEGGSHEGVDEVRYDAADVPVPPFLPDTPETREELAHYYQSVTRIDRGVARLVKVLKEAGVYDRTLFVFTSDHGMAFAGGKTTVYEAGLRVPLVVRDPYQSRRGVRSDALVSHTDHTPTLLDFAGGLDADQNAPKTYPDLKDIFAGQSIASENRDGGETFDAYHGRSYLPCLADPDAEHHDAVMASHTFHEIQMYYPMRVIRDRRYKLIWNIAHPLPFPFASDLWAASSWQAQWRKGPEAAYGTRTVDEYRHRPEFELYAIATDPHESNNLADSESSREILEDYKRRLREMQTAVADPWVLKWEYE